jgi:NMD protein affecting ribosome stability and mRNA decay
LCTPCYNKNLLDVAAATGTTCVTCGTDTTCQWLNCKDEPGTKICRPCYDKILLDVAAAAGTTCVKCGTDTTRGQWLNCKDEPGIKICLSCYSKDSYKKKKAAKANDK